MSRHRLWMAPNVIDIIKIGFVEFQIEKECTQFDTMQYN